MNQSFDLLVLVWHVLSGPVGLVALSILPSLLMWLASIARKEGALPPVPLLPAGICATILGELIGLTLYNIDQNLLLLAPFACWALCGIFLNCFVDLSRLESLLLSSAGCAPIAASFLCIWWWLQPSDYPSFYF